MSNNHLHNHRSRPLEDVFVRAATDADAEALARLAQLDSGDAPEMPALIADVGGQPRAAISLADGRTIADPFQATAGLVATLRARAGLPVIVSSSPLKALGRSVWGRRHSERRARPAAPSAPSVPGIPVVPGRTA